MFDYISFCFHSQEKQKLSFRTCLHVVFLFSYFGDLTFKWEKLKILILGFYNIVKIQKPNGLRPWVLTQWSPVRVPLRPLGFTRLVTSRSCEISRGVRKLTRTFTVIQNKIL